MIGRTPTGHKLSATSLPAPLTRMLLTIIVVAASIGVAILIA
jgi:hypothetical protein